jgi:O-antigen/teichoic acid export membrane protein
VTSSRVLAGRAAVYTTANLANSAIPFLLLPLLTRVLSPGDYGLVAVFSTTVTVLGALTGLSVHGAVSVRFADASVDMARYTGTVLCLLGASTTVVILLALSAGEWLGERVGLGSGWLLAATLASAGHFAAQVRLVLWQARGMPVHYGVLQVLQTVLNLGLSILLVLALDLGWEGRAIGISAAAILTGAIGIALLWRCREMVLQPSVAYARDALRFGIPLIPHVIGGVAIANSDRLVVAGIAGLHEAGIYAAGMQLGMLVAVLADAVVKAVSPWLYASLGKGDAAVQHSIVRLSYLYFAGIAMVAALTVLATPWLLHLIGRDFRSSGDVLAFVAIGSAFGGMYLMVVSQIFYARRNEWLSMITLSVGAFNIALTWWLVERRGAVGAAQAFAVSQFLLFVCTWYAASRFCPMPWGQGLRGLLRRRPSVG